MADVDDGSVAAWPSPRSFLRLAEQNWSGRQSVLLYEEHDLSFPRPKSTAFHIPPLAAGLLRAQEADDRIALVRQALAELGFEWMVYGTVAAERHALQPRAFLCTYANRALLHRYFSRRHHEVDPFFQGSAEPMLPTAWTVDELAEHRSLRSARGLAYLTDLIDSGVTCGLSFDVPGSSKHNERAIISLLSSQRPAHPASEDVMHRALSFACCLHYLLSRHALIPSGVGVPTRRDGAAR